MFKKPARKFFLFALGVVLVDQIVKLIVKLNMEMGLEGEIKVLGELFKLHFIENEGAAFGLTLSSLFGTFGLDLSPVTGKLILSIFSIIAVGVIGYVLYRQADHRSPLPWFIALIFGGALGNIIDRTFYGVWFNSINNYEGGLLFGRVVDMFYLDIWQGYLPNWIPLMGGSYYSFWPIFNIADAAISIGIVTILIFQGRFFKQDERSRQGEVEKTEEVTASTPAVEGSNSANPIS